MFWSSARFGPQSFYLRPPVWLGFRLEPPSPAYFLKWVLANFLPGLVLNHGLPRPEPPCLTYYLYFHVSQISNFVKVPQLKGIIELVSEHRMSVTRGYSHWTILPLLPTLFFPSVTLTPGQVTTFPSRCIVWESPLNMMLTTLRVLDATLGEVYA
jgi:hypothetical protein